MAEKTTESDGDKTIAILGNIIETLKVINGNIVFLARQLQEVKLGVEELKNDSAFMCWSLDTAFGGRDEWEDKTKLKTTPSIVYIPRPNDGSLEAAEAGPQQRYDNPLEVPRPPKRRGFGLFGSGKDKPSEWE